MAASPDAAGWLAQLEVIERLMHDDASYDEGSSIVGHAIERLYAYEHIMPPSARQRAREQVWARDFPDAPLPTDRGAWALCQCRTCAITRRLEWARRQPTVYEVQHAVLQRQRRS